MADSQTTSASPSELAANGARDPHANGSAPVRDVREQSATAGLIALIRHARKRAIEPLADYGFFGPGSVTWRVWSYPTSVSVGFSRSVVVEELDPFLVAAVDATGKIYSQPRTRYDRTLKYFATKFFGDSRTAVKASAVLMKIHARAVGVDPVSGVRFDANNPDSQLWIHVTAWHSVLYAYEIYGPGRLSPEDETRYWQECAVAAQLQTIDPDTVPRSREEVREYFDRMRPRLAASEATQRAMDHLMNAEVLFPPLPALLKPGGVVFGKLLRVAIIATLPRWQRQLGGLGQPRILDLLIRPLMRINFRVVARFPRLELMLLGLASPGTVPIAGPMLLGIRPQSEETLSPAQAFARHGVPTPAELYAQLSEEPTATLAHTPSSPLNDPVRAAAA